MAVARISLVASAAAIAALGRAAAGSPVDDPTNGRAVFTGASVPSPTSIQLDPAAIAAPGPLGESNAPPDTLYVGATSTFDQIHIDRRSLDLDTGAESADGEVRDVLVSPGADIGYIYHPNGTLALGAQLRMPPGQQFLQDHQSVRYYTLGGYDRDIEASLALGVHVASPVWVGASVTIDEKLLRLRYARDTALAAGSGAGGITSSCGDGPCGVENPAASETYDIKVREHDPFGDGYIVNLGVMLRLAPNSWLAVAYHTPPGGATTVQNELDGSVTITRAPRDGGGTLTGDAAVYISQPASVDAEFRTRLPYDLDLHVGGRWLNLSRESGYDVQLYWDTFPAAGIPQWTERPRGFHDTFAIWSGVEQVDTGERWRLGARLGFESSAIDADQTTPLTIAPASATLDLGAQLRLSQHVVVQLGYGLQFFPSVDVTSSEFDPRDAVTCVGSDYNYALPACAATRGGYAIPTADGDYSRIEHAVRLGLRYDVP
jgi:hypothetical protein